MKRLSLFTLCILLGFGMFAANTNPESIDSISCNTKGINNKRPFETAIIGLPMLISGVALKHYDNNLSHSQTSFANYHSAKADDYLRFLPGVLMYGMKLSGVESASSWKKMIVADAFSSAIMVGSVELLKHTTDYRRPDGTDYSSFPSGHSAIAFMMATMLHKEYGSVSPFFSIGGYALATYSAMSRVVNNRHWSSDVLCGAGIGILSTEIGYYLSELIFKEDKIPNEKLLKEEDRFGIGMNFGVSLTNFSYNINDLNVLSLGNGTVSGITANYKLNKFLSLEGQVNYNLFPVMQNDQYKSKMLQNLNVIAGVSGNYKFNNGIGVGARVLGGYNNFFETNVDGLKLGGTNNAVMKTGIFLNINPYNNIDMQLFADYNLTGSISKDFSKNTNYFSIGTSAIFSF